MLDPPPPADAEFVKQNSGRGWAYYPVILQDPRGPDLRKAHGRFPASSLTRTCASKEAPNVPMSMQKSRPALRTLMWFGISVLPRGRARAALLHERKHIQSSVHGDK